jgi:flagellar protein FliT
MSTQEYILKVYGSISAKTGEMLEAAKGSDWDRLASLEQDCRALAETLRRVDNGAPGSDAAYLQRKAELIHKVLADDADIRKFTEPWMNQLAAYLGTARQEYQLRRAYESDHGS